MYYVKLEIYACAMLYIKLLRFYNFTKYSLP